MINAVRKTSLRPTDEAPKTEPVGQARQMHAGPCDDGPGSTIDFMQTPNSDVSLTASRLTLAAPLNVQRNEQ